MNEHQLLQTCATDGIQKIVVGAVIIYAHKCLCLQRVTNDFMGGLVELPSGSVDDGEDLVQALIREVEEEVGITLTEDVIQEYIASFDYISGSGKKTRQLNFKVVLSSLPTIQLNPQEHDHYFWVARDDFEVYRISSETKQIITVALK